MTRGLCICGLLLAVGCVDGSDGLGPGIGPVDAGVSDPPRDAGVSPDSGAPRADAGVERPDAAPPPDAGFEPECPTGWTTIATTDAAQGIQTESFAAVESGYAATWNVFDGEWSQRTYLQFFDAALGPRGPPTLVGSGSRVVAVDGRFLSGGPGGVQWYDADGTPGAAVNVGPFMPHAVIGGRIFGRVLRNASGPAPAELVDDQLRIFAVSVGFDTEVVFGDDRMVVVEGAMTGATVRLFSLEGRGANALASHSTVPVENGGVRWLPTNLSGGAWNPDRSRFELLFAVNMANGRFYGPEVFSLDDTALTAGPLLLDPRVEVSHGSLEGAVAMSDGRLAVAYNDTYPQSDVELNIVIDGAAQTHPIGGNIRSRPVLVATPGGLAVLSAFRGPGAGGSWENELRLRCDLL